MPLMLTPRGQRIKQLRERRETEYRQKTIAAKARISVRTLRRIENENKLSRVEDLRRLAAALDTTLDDIAFATDRPRLVSDQPEKSVGVRSEESHPGFIEISRYSTTYLRTVKGAQDLCEQAGFGQEIVPYILVQADAERLALIEELLSLLKAMVLRKWQILGPAALDRYDRCEFPEASRLKRLAELLVLLKGNDIRVVADTHMKHYQDGEAPWLPGEKYYTQLIVGFAPPVEYGQESIEVPVDHGRDLKIPTKPPF
jgi:transcriptional regulator with XRE-family HTH domain